MRFVFIDGMKTKSYTASTPYKEGLGGTQSAICLYCEQLAKLGHEVILVNEQSEESVDLGVRHVSNSWLFQQSKFKTDVVVLCAAIPPALVDALEDRFDFKLSIIWHGNYTFEPAVTTCQDYIYKFDLCGFVSEFQRNRFCETYGIPIEKTCLMRNGYSPAFAKPSPPQEKQMELLYFSSPDRGMEHFQQIWPFVHAKFPEAKLSIYSSKKTYGSTDGEFIIKVKENLAKLPNVFVNEPLGQRELAEKCRAAAFFAYPTHFVETSCICCLESRAAGCLTIVSDIGVFPEYVSDCVHYDERFHERFAESIITHLTEFKHNRDLYNKKSEELSRSTQQVNSYEMVVHDFLGDVFRTIDIKRKSIAWQAYIPQSFSPIYLSETVPRFFASKVAAANFFLQLGNHYYNSGYHPFAENQYLRSWSILKSSASAQNLVRFYSKRGDVAKMLEWYLKLVPLGGHGVFKDLLKGSLSGELQLALSELLTSAPLPALPTVSVTPTSAPAPLPLPLPLPAPAPLPLPLPAPAPVTPAVSITPTGSVQLHISEVDPWSFFEQIYVVHKHPLTHPLSHNAIGFQHVEQSREDSTREGVRTRLFTETYAKANTDIDIVVTQSRLWEHIYLNKLKDGWVLIMNEGTRFLKTFTDSVFQSYLDSMPADAKCIHFGTFSNETQSVGNYVKLPALCFYNCYAIHTSLLPMLMAHTFDDVHDMRVEGLYGLALNGVKGMC
jgi:glycosyltransferase involved in cell wall biosynthesis